VPPPLSITFRSKINNVVNNHNGNPPVQARGYLKIKVLSGLKLKSRVSYAMLQVGLAHLSTRQLSSSDHPEWNEMITFKNFRPDNNKKGLISVFDHSALFKDKLIGEAEFQLPTRFNDVQRDTINLIDKKGKIVGEIILNSIVVDNANSINHLKKF